MDMKSCVVIYFSIRHLEMGNPFPSAQLVNLEFLELSGTIWNLYPDRADAFLTCLANDDKEQTWSKHGPKLEIETFGDNRFYSK